MQHLGEAGSGQEGVRRVLPATQQAAAGLEGAPAAIQEHRCQIPHACLGECTSLPDTMAAAETAQLLQGTSSGTSLVLPPSMNLATSSAATYRMLGRPEAGCRCSRPAVQRLRLRRHQA